MAGYASLWDLPMDQRPVEDMREIAQLLSGDTGSPTDEPAQPLVEPLEKAWQRLRATYPEEFTTSIEEMMAWHEFQARESESEKQWSAAVFHLEHLLSLRPNDPSLVNRLTRAKEHLKKEDQ
jgi:hypothetical protein